MSDVKKSKNWKDVSNKGNSHMKYTLALIFLCEYAGMNYQLNKPTMAWKK